VTASQMDRVFGRHSGYASLGIDFGKYSAYR
jgi:hypothetical protein